MSDEYFVLADNIFRHQLSDVTRTVSKLHKGDALIRVTRLGGKVTRLRDVMRGLTASEQVWMRFYEQSLGDYSMYRGLLQNPSIEEFSAQLMTLQPMIHDNTEKCLAHLNEMPRPLIGN